MFQPPTIPRPAAPGPTSPPTQPDLVGYTLAQAITALAAHEAAHPGDLSETRWALVEAVYAANDCRISRMRAGSQEEEEDAPDNLTIEVESIILRSTADLMEAVALWLGLDPDSAQTWWDWAADHIWWMEIPVSDSVLAAAFRLAASRIRRGEVPIPIPCPNCPCPPGTRGLPYSAANPGKGDDATFLQCYCDCHSTDSTDLPPSGPSAGPPIGDTPANPKASEGGYYRVEFTAAGSTEPEPWASFPTQDPAEQFIRDSIDEDADTPPGRFALLDPDGVEIMGATTPGPRIAPTPLVVALAPLLSAMNAEDRDDVLGEIAGMLLGNRANLPQVATRQRLYAMAAEGARGEGLPVLSDYFSRKAAFWARLQSALETP